MSIIMIAILAVAGIISLFVIVKFITGCLPKILLLIVIAVLAYLIYNFFIK